MQQRSAGVRGLVFGSLMAALTVIFALVPFLNFFLPIPLVLAFVRFGGRTAILTAIVAVIFSAMFSGPIAAFLILVPSGILPGLTFGYGMRHKLKPLVIGVLSVFVFVIGFASVYVVSRTILMPGKDPIAVAMESPEMKQLMNPVYNAMENYLNKAEERSPSQKQQLDVQRALLRETREQPAATAWTLLPAGLFLGGVVTTWLNYTLCRWILPRFGHEVPSPTPFAEFRLPIWVTLSFPLLTFALGQFVGPSQINAHWSYKVLVNVAQPLQLVVVLAGIAVAYGWLRKREVAKVAAVGLSLVPIVFGATGIMLYVMLAMWDSLFDFRKLGHGVFKPPEPTS